MNVTRQLAAIMFTDIVGYTALMGNDEEKALRVLHLSREIQKTAVRNKDGKWLKEMGDGVLVQFDSALKAVLCAIEIQVEAQRKIEQKIRIGIHLGDVTLENDDVFGDGVNIASRLQNIADPGGIYVSEAVHHAIGARQDIQFKFLADVNLKNVPQAIKTYCIAGNGLPSPSHDKIKGLVQPVRKKHLLIYQIVVAIIIIAIAGYFTRSSWLSATSDVHRLVVLPVADLSRNKKGELLVDGIQSAMITQIGTLGTLQVISRTSSAGYRSAGKTIPQIANELHVDLALESELVRMDDTIQLQVRFIQMLPEERQIWSKTYTEVGQRMMHIYDDIVLDITDAINIEMSPEEKKLLTQTRNINPDAYREFLKGQHYIDNFTRNDFELAEKSFRQALAYDPDFLDARIGLVWLWVVQLQMGIMPREEAYPMIKEEEAKVLAYQIESENVLRMEASIHSYVEWQWEKGIREIERALVLNPNNAASHQSYGYSLAIIGYHDLAEKEMNLASELDPFNPFIESFYGWDYLYARQYDKAIAHCEKSLQLSPAHWVAKDAIRQAYFAQGKLDQSFEMTKGLYADQNMNSVVAALDKGYKAGGFKEGMKQCAETLIELSETMFVSPEGIAENYAYAGEYELSIVWLEKALEIHDQDMNYLPVTPVYDGLRDDPRFKEILKKVGVPDKEEFTPHPVWHSQTKTEKRQTSSF